MIDDPPPPPGHHDPVLDLAGLTRPHWQARALCRGRLDIEWFPGRGASSRGTTADGDAVGTKEGRGRARGPVSSPIPEHRERARWIQKRGAMTDQLDEFDHDHRCDPLDRPTPVVYTATDEYWRDLFDGFDDAGRRKLLAGELSMTVVASDGVARVRLEVPDHLLAEFAPRLA